MFATSDFADWLDENSDAIWDKVDDWAVEIVSSGEAHPVLAFAWWADTLPFRVQYAGLKGLFDVLRFGCDMEIDSVGGVLKGTAINILRAATVLMPSGGGAVSGSKTGIRQAGMLAIQEIEEIKGIAGPCNYHAINLVGTYLKGAPVRFFGPVDEILAAGGSLDGINNTPLLATKRVLDMLRANKISFREVPGLKTVEDVLRYARSADGPVHFAIEWADDALNPNYHALVAVKNAAGEVRIIEYVGGPSGSSVGGFSSWEEFVRIKQGAGWGEGIEGANLRTDPGNPVIEYASQHMRVLKFIDGTLTIGIPLAIGIQHGSGAFASRVGAMAASLGRFLAKRMGDDAPPLPDLETNPSEYTREILVPQKPPYWYTVTEGIPERDWPSSRAGRDYDDVLLWPLILEATQQEEKKAGGIKWRDQNKLYPGQQIFVPDISGYSRQKITAARTRGRDWKRVG